MLDRSTRKSKLVARSQLKQKAKQLYPVIRKKKARKIPRRMSNDSEDNSEDNSESRKDKVLPAPKSLRQIELEVRRETLYPNLETLDWRLENEDLYLDMNQLPEASGHMSTSLHVNFSNENLHNTDENKEVEETRMVRDWVLNFEKYLNTFDEIKKITNMEEYERTLEFMSELQEKLTDFNKRINEEMGPKSNTQVTSSLDNDVDFINEKASEIMEEFKKRAAEYERYVGTILY